MLNDDGEELISFVEAATLVPPHGVDRATVSRWSSSGIRCGGGILLKSWKIAGRRYTSRASLERFLDECNRRGALGYQSCALSKRVLTAQKRSEEQSAEAGDVTDDECLDEHGE